MHPWPRLTSPFLKTKRGGGERSRREIGELGERLAERYLKRKGWKLFARNFRAPKGGEVDLVFRGGRSFEELIFVEVKTRTFRGYGRPLDAVDVEKQHLIVRGATEWLKLVRSQQKVAGDVRAERVAHRYDVVEVILEDGERPEIRLVENAF